MSQISGGLDEVGWGALAGFVLSAVAVFRDKDLGLLPSGVSDSKQVSAINREGLYLPIMNVALDIGFGHAWPWEIDDLGPGVALQLSYERALADLKYKPDVLIVDGSHRVRAWKGRQVVEPKADVKYREVSAASIVAKVARDQAMVELGRLYPQYQWRENKGYGTDSHRRAIKQYGLIVGDKTPIKYVHRRCYCRSFTNEEEKEK